MASPIISTFNSENLLKTCSILSFFTSCFFDATKVVKYATKKMICFCKFIAVIKHEWEQSFEESSHSPLANPKIVLSARLRLFKLAVPSGFSNHFSQPCAFPKTLVTVLRSSRSFDSSEELSSRTKFL